MNFSISSTFKRFSRRSYRRDAGKLLIKLSAVAGGLTPHQRITDKSDSSAVKRCWEF